MTLSLVETIVGSYNASVARNPQITVLVASYLGSKEKLSVQ